MSGLAVISDNKQFKEDWLSSDLCNKDNIAAKKSGLSETRYRVAWSEFRNYYVY